MYAYVGVNPLNATDPSGKTTWWFGGAFGEDEEEYSNDMMKALSDEGIQDVRHAPDSSTTNGALDLVIGVLSINQELPSSESISPGIGFEGVEYAREGGQYNLIGYSYGAVEAAQQALFEASNGRTVDNLVLVGAPMNESLLAAVMDNPNIANVLIMSLASRGDPINPPMTDRQIVSAFPTLVQQMQQGDGHFFLSQSGSVGSERRQNFARLLVARGIH